MHLVSDIGCLGQIGEFGIKRAHHTTSTGHHHSNQINVIVNIPWNILFYDVPVNLDGKECLLDQILLFLDKLEHLGWKNPLWWVKAIFVATCLFKTHCLRWSLFWFGGTYLLTIVLVNLLPICSCILMYLFWCIYLDSKLCSSSVHSVTVLVMRNIVFLMAWYLDLLQKMLYWINCSMNVSSFVKMHDKLHAWKWGCGWCCPNMLLAMPLTVSK